jgi:peptidoglycan hydrolase-like protein with peptidoglycan-binding domain
MTIRRSKRTVSIGLAAAVLLAAVAWIVGGQVRSPAQIAAETAAPDPSAITVPVDRQVLSSEVIVRGTVRYGSPQPVVLATSSLKQNSTAGSGSQIVTTRPKRGARFSEGSVVMSASGRPVFVLRGAQPSHRDIGPGSRGPDVRQLESALSRLGFAPGKIDGRFDGETAAAVANWYESEGWAPFGATDTQLDQLRTARANAAAARDAYLQSKIAIDTAAHPFPKGDIAQARIDVETARDTLDTAQQALSSQARSVQLAIANQKRDNALAVTDVTTKRAGVNRALNAQIEAQRNLAEAPSDTAPSERARLQASVRGAADDVTVAQAELNSATASIAAVREAGRDAVAKANADRTKAQKAVPTARRQLVLAEQRLRVLETPGDTKLQTQVAASAAKEARSTAADAARLARKAGVSVPADEVLFFSTLPLRVDSVRVRRGDAVTGRVMTVSNSRLAIDSSLSPNDAKLVRPGATVEVEEPDLGIKATGMVTQVADRPGTHKVDPGRVYLSITPNTAPAQLVGASVKLTIAVKSTKDAVLVVPVTALSVGADGNARLQVQRGGGLSQYVTVEPGLAAQGLVEVRPVNGRLDAGDLVVAGTRDGSQTSPADSAATDPSPASGTSGTSSRGGASGSSGSSGSKGSTGATEKSAGTTSGTSPGGTTGP